MAAARPRKQQLRLRRELDTDRETLARLDAQAEDERVREVLELEHFDHLLDIFVLLSRGNLSRLTEVSGEPHSLPNGGGALVNVHLLSVRRVAGEVQVERLAVEEQCAGDNTDVLALSEYIQTSCLAFVGS